MSILVPILVVLASVAAMEFVAYAAHRWIMHGWGWGWHRSHHEPHDGAFEKNDLYAVVFAGISVVMFMIGAAFVPWLFWVATGVTIYGALYFVVHDGLVHRRWPFTKVPRRGYLKRLVQAHRLHHAVDGREGCVSFGFLWAPPVDRLRRELRERGTLAVNADASRERDRAA